MSNYFYRVTAILLIPCLLLSSGRELTASGFNSASTMWERTVDPRFTQEAFAERATPFIRWMTRNPQPKIQFALMALGLITAYLGHPVLGHGITGLAMMPPKPPNPSEEPLSDDQIRSALEGLPHLLSYGYISALRRLQPLGEIGTLGSVVIRHKATGKVVMIAGETQSGQSAIAAALMKLEEGSSESQEWELVANKGVFCLFPKGQPSRLWILQEPAYAKFPLRWQVAVVSEENGSIIAKPIIDANLRPTAVPVALDAVIVLDKQSGAFRLIPELSEPRSSLAKQIAQKLITHVTFPRQGPQPDQEKLTEAIGNSSLSLILATRPEHFVEPKLWNPGVQELERLLHEKVLIQRSDESTSRNGGSVAMIRSLEGEILPSAERFAAILSRIAKNNQSGGAMVEWLTEQLAGVMRTDVAEDQRMFSFQIANLIWKALEKIPLSPDPEAFARAVFHAIRKDLQDLIKGFIELHDVVLDLEEVVKVINGAPFDPEKMWRPRDPEKDDPWLKTGAYIVAKAVILGMHPNLKPFLGGNWQSQQDNSIKAGTDQGVIAHGAFDEAVFRAGVGVPAMAAFRKPPSDSSTNHDLGAGDDYENKRWVRGEIEEFQGALSETSPQFDLAARITDFQNRLFARSPERQHRPVWVEEELDRLNRLIQTAEGRWKREGAFLLAEEVVNEIDKAADPADVSLVSLDGASGSGKTTLVSAIVNVWRQRHPTRGMYVVELDMALRDSSFRYAVEKLVVGESLTLEDLDALKRQEHKTPHGTWDVIEKIMDRAFGGQTWKKWMIGDKYIASGLAFTEQEIAAIQPGQPFLLEPRFWHDDVIHEILATPDYLRRIPRLKIYLSGYDRTKPEKVAVDDQSIRQGDLMLLVGKFANQPQFAGRYVLRTRLQVSAARARRQFFGRIDTRSAQTGVPPARRSMFYDLGLRPSWDAYESESRSLIELIIDPEQRTVNRIKRKMDPRPETSHSMVILGAGPMGWVLLFIGLLNGTRWHRNLKGSWWKDQLHDFIARLPNVYVLALDIFHKIDTVRRATTKIPAHHELFHAA